jgi:hypothetical protein
MSQYQCQLIPGSVVVGRDGPRGDNQVEVVDRFNRLFNGLDQ